MYLLAVQACAKGGQWERALSLMVERRTTVAIEAKEKLGELGCAGWYIQHFLLFLLSESASDEELYERHLKNSQTIALLGYLLLTTCH